ncbi:MAG: c-type cytochrome [Acetobacteraceae bacterium]
MRPVGRIAVLAACLALAIPAARAEQGSFERIQRGRYLVQAGDCAACHTPEGADTMSGGVPLRTPFGTIYSANISSDAETGIGAWTDAQFYRAMHEGISADGGRLFPAFPYPWFTKVTRDDVDAIRAYLRTLPAVKMRPPENSFPFPLVPGIAMGAWNWVFFTPGTYKPDPNKSPEWNRGAYLVEGLGHCGACHTPTNIAGSAKHGDAYQGGVLDNWFAPNLTNNPVAGLGSWTEDDIVSFLKTGRTATAVAYGPMAQVVRDSTSYLTESDLKAIAVYLKGMTGPKPGAPGRPAANVVTAGEAIYVDTCSACHQSQGQGVPGMFPALKGTAMVQSDNPTTIIRLILNGGQAVATDQHPTPVSMPDFGWKLSDEQVAAVASYVRSAWGNQGAPVSAGEVRSVRDGVQAASSAH